MASPAIFISYRREDSSGHAGRLFDRLVEHFGKERIYRDIDTIQAGENFVEAVRQKVNVSDVVLVLIGPRWLTATDEEGRWRLADENDLVRLEIATGLERNIRVIPVLLQGASMPRAKDLPRACRIGTAQRVGADVKGEYGGTALMMAAYSANLDVIQLLLSHGANVNAADSDGETALHYAARAGQQPVEIFRALLQKRQM